jgi:hypothetical protein
LHTLNLLESERAVDLEAFVDASDNIGKLFINPLAMPLIKARLSPGARRYWRNWRRLRATWEGARAC